jgi:hypothetical protein
MAGEKRRLQESIRHETGMVHASELARSLAMDKAKANMHK